MFITRFVMRDGSPNKDYIYRTEEEAREHLERFVEDDSKLYRNISVLDESIMTILSILLFDDNGNMVKRMDDKCFVKLNPKWRTEGESNFIFTVSNIHEDTERCRITCLNSGLSLPCCEDVDICMVDVMCNEDAGSCIRG